MSCLDPSAAEPCRMTPIRFLTPSIITWMPRA